MSLSFEILYDIPREQDSPERLLWLAVIERALMDYCSPAGDLQKAHKMSLNWFFFSTEMEPYNLNYISMLLFEDRSVSERVRRRIRHRLLAQRGRY